MVAGRALLVRTCPDKPDRHFLAHIEQSAGQYTATDSDTLRAGVGFIIQPSTRPGGVRRAMGKVAVRNTEMRT
jgi:hypothetical protein